MKGVTFYPFLLKASRLHKCLPVCRPIKDSLEEERCSLKKASVISKSELNASALLREGKSDIAPGSELERIYEDGKARLNPALILINRVIAETTV